MANARPLSLSSRHVLLLGALLTVLGCPQTESGPGKSGKSGKATRAAKAPYPWAGTYEGAGLRLALGAVDDGFSGSFEKGGQRFPLTAKEEGAELVGTFTSGEDAFPFRLDQRDDLSVELTTGGKTFTLERPANPLAAAPANPLSEGTPSAPAEPKKTGPAPMTASPELAATVPAPEPVKAPTQQPSAPGPSPKTQPEPVSPPDALSERPAARPAAPKTPPNTPPNTLPNTLPNTAPNTAGWRQHRHASGLGFAHPPAWRATDGPTGVALIPPNPASDAQGRPQEFCTFLVGPAPTPVPDSREALAYVDKLMPQGFPGIRRIQEPKRGKLGGRATMVLDYEGRNPAGVYRVRVFVFVLEHNLGVLASVVGTPKSVEARAPAFQQILTTLRAAKPALDRRLVGKWRYTDVRRSGNFSAVSDRYLLLAADGRCYSGGQTMANSARGGTVGVGVRGYDRQGRWSGSGGSLRMSWSNGNTETYQVSVSRDAFVLRNGRQKYLYERAN